MEKSPQNEATFCAAWVAKRRTAALWLVYGLTFVAHPVGVVLAPFVAPPPILDGFLALHGGAVALALVGVAGRKRAWLFKGVMITLFYATILSYGVFLSYINREMGAALATMLPVLGGFMGFSVFLPQVYPGGRLSLGLLLGVMVATAVVCMAPLPGGPVWALTYAIALGFSTAMRLTYDARVLREARSEYRFRMQVAPAHIVRHTTGDTGELTELFKPEVKFCVCISSDWRNYQELTSHLSPSQLAMSLNEYYGLCGTLLQTVLPRGNYYTDWIADELFVVVYAEGGVAEETLVDAALRFATELLKAKETFRRIHGLPGAIDVGLAAGPALIGLMGPEGQRKATALGEVPGRARRMQSAGKLVRKRRGSKDRVLFGQECLMRIKVPLPVEQLALADGEGIRDVKDRELFFLEVAEADAGPKRGVA